jgi:hypothetical protein
MVGGCYSFNQKKTREEDEVMDGWMDSSSARIPAKIAVGGHNNLVA